MSSQDVAYSYRRFSSLPQEQGDSVRRQTTLTEEWSQRTGIPVDWSLKIDKGLSGYTMENLDVGALGEFVKLVERGKVRRGSYLVVEALDRLTRAFEQDALRLILNLTGAGIRIVQLEPEECIFDSKSDSWQIMRLIMKLTEGHLSSKRKSGMISKARKGERERARGGEKIKEQHPAWLKLVGGKFEFVEPQTSVMRRIISLALGGRGCTAVARVLNNDNVPRFRHGKRWHSLTVHGLLTDGRIAGWKQPRTQDGKPDGPPIPCYYPPLCSQQELDKILGMIARRKKQVGRTGEVPNLFAHLLTDAESGGSLVSSKSKGGHHGEGYAVLQSPKEQVKGRSSTLAYLPFEFAILSCLAELPAVLMADEKVEDVGALRGQLAALEKRQAGLIADIVAKDSPTLRAVARVVDDQLAEVQGRLTVALQRLANAPADALEDAKAIIARLYASEDRREERLRLREAIRSIVDSMRVVIVPRGIYRAVAVQMRFASGRVRDYLIVYRRAVKVRQSKAQPCRVFFGSLATDDGAESPDFSDPATVGMIRGRLESLDVASLPMNDLPANVK